jgi:hypothetical protein
MTDLVFVVPFEPSEATTEAVVRVEDRVPLVGETVTVHQLTPPPVTHVMTEQSRWSWQELRDYVVGRIIATHGPYPRNDKKEMGIFKSFADRWGPDAPDIAKFAFEQMGGYWKNAPISVNRFCKASDPYFATPIIDHLNRNVR